MPDQHLARGLGVYRIGVIQQWRRPQARNIDDCPEQHDPDPASVLLVRSEWCFGDGGTRCRGRLRRTHANEVSISIIEPGLRVVGLGLANKVVKRWPTVMTGSNRCKTIALQLGQASA